MAREVVSTITDAKSLCVEADATQLDPSEPSYEFSNGRKFKKRKTYAEES